MTLVILTGVILIHIAFVLYTIFIWREVKDKRASKSVVGFITAAVLFDLGATGCMMVGTEKEFFTLHGILGYTALFVMVLDAIFIWRHRIKAGSEAMFGQLLDRYSKFAYVLWLAAFATGEYIAIMKI